MGIKISELNPLETPVDSDIIPIVDMDAGETKYIEFADLLGPEGPAGPAGADGEEVTIRVDGGYIQWRLGDGEWENLIAVSSLVGPQGEQGIQGPAGPAATLNWMGAWSALTEYDPLDVVSHEGVTYLCIATSTDDEPPDPVHWNAIGAVSLDADLSSLLDSVLGSTEGMVAKRGAATWSGEVPTSYRYVLFLPQSFGYPATNPAELIEWVGTNTTRQEARFDDTTEEFVTGGFPVPADYDSSGTITIQVIGRSLTAAASKNVAFTFRHLPLADSEAMDAAYTSSASGDSATDATQGDLEVHSWTVGTPGWTAGDWIDFKLSRNPSATNDLTGDWCLRAMVLKIPVTG